MKLDDIRKLIDAATPGPWTREPGTVCYVNIGDRYVITANGRTDVECAGNSAFIAASRDLLPKLLAVAEAAKNYFATEECRDCNSSVIFDALAALEGEG